MTFVVRSINKVAFTWLLSDRQYMKILDVKLKSSVKHNNNNDLTSPVLFSYLCLLMPVFLTTSEGNIYQAQYFPNIDLHADLKFCGCA